MEHTKDELIEAILVFVKKYGTVNNYLPLIKEYGMYSVVKEIVYDMFLNDFNTLKHSKDEIKAYKIILEYCKEIKETGFIEYLIEDKL
jgi:hypothetical protein